jgi:hypothetical protein
MIKDWDVSLSNCILDFKQNKKAKWSCEKVKFNAKKNENISLTQPTTRLQSETAKKFEQTKPKIDLDAIISMKTNKPKTK